MKFLLAFIYILANLQGFVATLPEEKDECKANCDVLFAREAEIPKSVWSKWTGRSSIYPFAGSMLYKGRRVTIVGQGVAVTTQTLLVEAHFFKICDELGKNCFFDEKVALNGQNIFNVFANGEAYLAALYEVDRSRDLGLMRVNSEAIVRAHERLWGIRPFKPTFFASPVRFRKFDEKILNSLMGGETLYSIEPIIKPNKEWNKIKYGVVRRTVIGLYNHNEKIGLEPTKIIDAPYIALKGASHCGSSGSILVNKDNIGFGLISMGAHDCTASFAISSSVIIGYLAENSIGQ